MRFTTTGESVVSVTSTVDLDGDVVIKANGVNVLWLRKNGKLTLNHCDPQSLQSLGFQLHDNHVAIMS